MISKLILSTLEKDNDLPPRQRVSHYPSSASFKYSDGTLIGPDLLNQYLGWKGVPPSNLSDGTGLFKMRLGDGTHTEIAKILSRAGVKAISEVGGKVNIPGLLYPISYRVDGVLEFDSKTIILEVKSSTYNQIFSDWGVINKGPKEDHLLQVICYLEFVPGADHAVILYVDRADGGMVEFKVSKNKNRYYLNGKMLPELSFTGIVDRWKELETYLKDNKTPDPEYRAWLSDDKLRVMPAKTIKGKKYKTDWRVSYSPYKDYIYLNPDNYKFTFNAEHDK